MRNTRCGVLLLAGGKSSRLGQNKALLEYDGVPMIRRIAEQCAAFPEKILSSPIELPVEGFWRIADDIPGCGPLGGIVSALRQCRSEALLVLSCDLACYRAELGDYLLSFLDSGWPAWCLRSRDGRTHYLCGIYTKAALPALEAMLAQNHLKMAESFAATGGHVLELQYTVFPDRMMANINTWKDYYAIFRPPVFAICGLHNTGKTTLCEKLIQHFSGMGYRVAGIKHDGHSFEPDVPGTDSWRLRKAGANPVMVYNREILAYNEKNVYRADQLIEAALQNADLVLLEGFKDSRWPKAEILREGEPSVSREPMALISDWGWEGGLPHYTRNDVEGIARMIQETLHLVPPSSEHDEFGKDKREDDGN